MKRIVPILAAVAFALPGHAEDSRPNPDLQEGMELMSEAFRLLFQGLSTEMEPLAEAWREMIEDLEDLPEYEAPEMLPNGDIIIRRKTPLTEGETGTEL